MRAIALLLALFCAYLLALLLAQARAGTELAAERDLWRARAISMRAFGYSCAAHAGKVERALKQCKRGLDL